MSQHCFLMKAEPDARIENGHDVSFGVEKFEEVKVTSWEGVRSHEAKKVMMGMELEDRVLFYASNCKVPGITALAKVVKLYYPDHNAWDSSHPYFDPKSDSENPKWFMVDVEFKMRLNHLVGLKLLQVLRDCSTPPECVASYLTQEHLNGIKVMQLLNKGRLSVQKVEPIVYEAVVLLGTNGGWEELLAKKIAEKKVAVKAEKDEKKKASPVKKGKKETSAKGKGKRVKKDEEESDEEADEDEADLEDVKDVAKVDVDKVDIDVAVETEGRRTSKRHKKV